MLFPLPFYNPRNLSKSKFQFLVDYQLHYTQCCNSSEIWDYMKLIKQWKEEFLFDVPSQEGQYIIHDCSHCSKNLMK